MNLNIRNATRNDMPDVLNLIRELAVFEREPDAVEINVNDLIQHGFSDRPMFSCFVAETDEGIIGMALVYFRFSTWKGKSLHLEDLIVSRDYRGQGVGSALYSRVLHYAHEQEVNRVEWVVLDWNEGAIDFYEKSGAKLLKDWYLVQMESEGLRAFVSNEK
ncbi:MAG: GNAT family N-acetyltransferase [Flavobacteriaceae bacterium]|nr:GNAT family N-acetyltransferase [Flavobacteriaceae bacterium]